MSTCSATRTSKPARRTRSRRRCGASTPSLATAVEGARFNRLRAQEAAGGFHEHPPGADAPFFRRGRSGGWREALTAEQARRVVANHRAVMIRLGYTDAVAEVDAL